MSTPFHDFTSLVAAGSAITPDDILALRQSVWRDGLIDSSEAEAIVALNAAIAEPSTAWTDFFVEALATWLVDQQEPRGYVADADVDWLIALLPRDGVQTMAELELLVRVLEKAIDAPEQLRQFTLAQVERAVIAGSGPTRDGGKLEPGCITGTEARLLRRLIFSAGGDRPAGVSLAEAEMLFRLKDATLAADNAPEWQQLFVQGVANYLQASGGSHPPSRERALELERFVGDSEISLGGFVGRLAKLNANSFASAMRDGFGYKPAREWEAEFERAAGIERGEQSWLDGQVNGDGHADAYEQALITFLKLT